MNVVLAYSALSTLQLQTVAHCARCATASYRDFSCCVIKISVFDLFVSSRSLRTCSQRRRRLSGRSPWDSLVARHSDHIDHPDVTFSPLHSPSYSS